RLHIRISPVSGVSCPISLILRPRTQSVRSIVPNRSAAVILLLIGILTGWCLPRTILAARCPRSLIPWSLLLPLVELRAGLGVGRNVLLVSVRSGIAILSGSLHDYLSPIRDSVETTRVRLIGAVIGIARPR